MRQVGRRCLATTLYPGWAQPLPRIGVNGVAGVAGNDTKLDVVGQPNQGTYTINGTTYSSSQLGSLTGQLKFGNSVSPYVGFGWGNPSGSAVCNQAQSDVASEAAKLRHKADILQWYPMVSLGIGVRF